MKHNEFGEVISVNGLITGQRLGMPLQDATPANPEDNQPYATELNTKTRMANSEINWDKQPQQVLRLPN